MLASISERAISILQATRDGDILAPQDLKLLENAVNGHLSDAGMERFNDLHDSVMIGAYQNRGFHGQADLSCDHEGFVYWKGIQVEHFTRPYDPAHTAYCEELVGRCLHLQTICVPVNSGTTVWYWDWFDGMTIHNPWKRLLSHCPAFYSRGDDEILVLTQNVVYRVVKGVPERMERFLNRQESYPDPYDYHALIAQGYGIVNAGQGKNLGTVYANMGGITRMLERYRVPQDLLD